MKPRCACGYESKHPAEWIYHCMKCPQASLNTIYNVKPRLWRARGEAPKEGANEILRQKEAS